MALLADVHDFNDGTVSADTFAASTVAPVNALRYSGYTVFSPPRAASSGTQFSGPTLDRGSPAVSHSVRAGLFPGRKCGTQWRSVPPFSAKEPLHVSIVKLFPCATVYVVEWM